MNGKEQLERTRLALGNKRDSRLDCACGLGLRVRVETS